MKFRLSRRQTFLSILLILSCYLCFFEIPFPGVDDLIYKEAGYRMSQGLGFSAPAIQGRYPGSERLFVVYPPVYPFLLGSWFHLFGFSLRSSILFSLLICGVIAALCVALCRRTPGDSPPGVVYGFAGVAWTWAASSIHRPDPLYLLFGLTLLWVLENRLPFPLKDWHTHLLLILLITLCVGTSPGMGFFMLPFFAAVFTAAFGFTRKSLLLFSAYSLLGIGLVLCLWASVFRAEPRMFWDQFLSRALTLRVEEIILRDWATWVFFLKKNLEISLSFPLMFLLFVVALSWVLKSPPDKIKKAFLIQLSVLFGTWTFFLLGRTKSPYLNMIHIYLLVLCGRVFLPSVLTAKSSFLQRLWRGAAWLGIWVAMLPFVRMGLMPLTWAPADLYSTNAKRIGSQISKGSTVLTDVRFWHLLTPAHRIYDAYFSHSSVYESDYVLLASGGSGRPDAAWFPPMTAVERRYFTQNFVRKDSTLSKTPNRLLGFPIARSRWCYRFDLYARKKRI